MIDAEIISVDNCPHTTIQSLECLEDIRAVIGGVGGKISLADIIIQESPTWFSWRQQQETKRTARRIRWRANKDKLKNSKSKFWRSDEIEYLFLYWVSRDHSWIARSLGRTSKEVRRKAKGLMKPELYEARFRKYNKKR